MFRDTRSSRQTCWIDFTWINYARLIFEIVSTTNIPNSLPQSFEDAFETNYQGALLDADYPNTGGNLACWFTVWDLLRTRKALLSKTIDLANKVRGLLKIFGMRLPKTVKHGSFDGVVRPMMEVDEVLAHAMLPLLDARLVLYQHF
ncbi:hypothetical protein [Roseovarius sp.]|uniref:hypothetical protein n=1 Tax=Roseovarius sp. TaxID=1486281 RepID=UPI0026188413|nr:hypothetical protein [Roseovarius sp.]